MSGKKEIDLRTFVDKIVTESLNNKYFTREEVIDKILWDLNLPSKGKVRIL